jgi:hypothetical protein
LGIQDISLWASDERNELNGGIYSLLDSSVQDVVSDHDGKGKGHQDEVRDLCGWVKGLDDKNQDLRTGP